MKGGELKDALLEAFKMACNIVLYYSCNDPLPTICVGEFIIPIGSFVAI